MASLPFEWKRGQHLAIIGDTGTGKTTVAQAIMDERRYCLALKSKADDVVWQGYKRVRKVLPDLESTLVERLLLEPRYEDQWLQFALALDRAFTMGNWTLLIDDLPHVQDLDRRHLLLIKRLLIMGRSVGDSVISAMQRPVDISRYAIAEARITISFMLEGRDILSIRDATNPIMAEAVESLGEHDIAMFHRATRDVWVGRLDLASGQFVGQYVGEPRQSTLTARAGAAR